MELQRIYVVSERHGTGIGSILMKECIKIAKENQMEVLWLGVWELNTKAIAFYEKFGFHRVGAHVFLLGEDP